MNARANLLAVLRRHAESHRASAGCDAYSAQEAPRLEAALAEATLLAGTLNVYSCHYYKSFGYGAYDEYEENIVANTQQEALGFALMAHPDSDANHWQIDLIDATKAGVA